MSIRFVRNMPVKKVLERFPDSMSISEERFRGEPGGGGGKGGPKSFQLPERPAFSRLMISNHLNFGFLRLSRVLVRIPMRHK